MMMRIKLIPLFLMTALAVLQWGCATSSVFKPYTSQADEFIAPVAVGQIDPALEMLAKETESKDKILYLMERGRIAQLGDRIEESKNDFDLAIVAIEENRERALISARDVGARGSSIMVNDNVIPYAGFTYEKVFLHNFQALNYLSEGDLEGAAVEIRNANYEQEWAMDHHQKELAKIQEETDKQEAQYDEEQMNAEFDGAYQTMNDYAARVLNSFQNAYSFYISGLVYEMRNELNDAYIDYLNALDIYPTNIYLQRDALRLSKQFNKDEYEELGKKFPQSAAWVENNADPSGGELIVIFERDLAPQKAQIKIPLPLFRGIVTTSFPIYNIDPNYAGGLFVSNGETVLGETQPICDVSALAVKALQEELPGIIMREVARVVAKTATQKAASDNAGLIGSLVATAYNLATSNADLRAWYTLPRDVQIFRAPLPEGACELSGTYAGATVNLNTEIHKGGKTIVRVAKVEGAWYATSYVF